MEPVLYVLAIMGCADGGELCQEARVTPVQYTSIQACQAAMHGALERSTDLPYPTLEAACRRTTPVMVKNARRATAS